MILLASSVAGCAADSGQKIEASSPDLSEASLSDAVRADRVSGGTQIISAIKFGATEDGAFATGGTAARPSAVGYTVVGKRGARVKLDLTSTDGDAVLSLYGPLATTWATARRVAYHDDLSSRNTNSRIEIALPSDGTYLIVAQEYYNDAASFTLAIACNGPECWLGCAPSCPTGSRCIDHHIVCVRAPCPTMTCEPNETPIAPGELGASCGGRGQQQCNAGLYCQYSDAAICGQADGPGTCQFAPSVCTKELFPVCSCSGVTYANRCFAYASSDSVLHTGPCAPVVTEIAHYFFGNQISSSSFVLNSDGTATVTERVQPSLPPGIRNLALTTEQITRVRELVEIIASTNATITSTRPAPLGSSSGSLEVNAENGEQYVVFQDRWTTGTPRITRTKTRAAAAAIELLAIVNTLVSRDASF